MGHLGYHGSSHAHFYSLAVVCLFYRNINWNTAVAFRLLLPSLLCNVFAVLTDQARKLGISASGPWIRIVLNGFTSYTLFTNVPCTSMILKLYSTWCIMTGAYCFLAPEKAMANGLLLGMTVFGVPKGPIVFFAFVLGMIVSTLSI